MKKNLLYYAFLGVISFTSCTKVIYSHSQVMQRFQTKQDVVNRFGLPTEKRIGEGIEEWLYNYGTVTTSRRFGNRTTQANVYGTYNGIAGNSNTNSINVTQFSQYSKYIKFTFQGDRVLKWESQGVDYTERKKAPGKTVLAVALYVVLLSGIAYAAASSVGN